jgi:hypothetical protein
MALKHYVYKKPCLKRQAPPSVIPFPSDGSVARMFCMHSSTSSNLEENICNTEKEPGLGEKE